MFIVKYTFYDSIKKYKIKLMTRKFSQVYDLNYTKIFAFIFRINSLRMFLIIMTLKNMKPKQINIINAFIESKLNEIIYMYALSEFDVKNDKIFKLFRSLYDLKQSIKQ